MSQDDAEFVAELQSLLADGRKIEAIKLYRERTGAGLKEAVDAVQSLQTGGPLPPPPASRLAAGSTDLEADVADLMREGQKIAAVKLYRERTGFGLKEAKDAVEAIARERGITSSGGGCLGIILLAVVLLAASAAAV